MELIATTAFGIEAVAIRELRELDFAPRVVRPGRVQFTADSRGLARASLWGHTIERLRILIDDFAVNDFDTLFEHVRELPWETWIPPDGSFPVTAKSIRSGLSSVPAVQRTVKKAIVERLLHAHGTSLLPETAASYPVEIALLNDSAQLTLDTSGPGLHKRGYRPEVGRAPLRETLAATLVLLSHWRPPAALLDPFCGSGTILIEAAMLGRRIPPGLRRSFLAESWASADPAVWQAERDLANAGILPPLERRLSGFDLDNRALRQARDNARAAGVEEDIHFQQRPFAELQSPHEYGCLITNPPYGERIRDPGLMDLYRSIPLVLRRLPTWSHYILTSVESFEALIGQRADRRRKLYNGRILCHYYQFLGPKPPRHPAFRGRIAPETAPETAPKTGSETAPETASGPEAPRPTEKDRVFGGLSAKAHAQAELFRARLVHRARHLRRWPKRGITCFRIYDQDIPEIPLIVDRYEDQLVIYEAGRTLTRTPAEQADWLELMIQTASDVLQVERAKIHLKRRRRQDPVTQYQRLERTDRRDEVREGGLRFWINPRDYLDTGLYLDHRIARQWIRSIAEGKRVLNLFAYTGAFTVYAAAGGAAETTSVDLSPNYLRWARDNLELNQLQGARHRFHAADAHDYVRSLPTGAMFDLVIVDAPTFSNSKRLRNDWDVQSRHVELLRDLEPHLSPPAGILFSVHSRRFKFQFEPTAPRVAFEITAKTVPEDFRDRRTHRCWWIAAFPPRWRTPPSRSEE